MHYAHTSLSGSSYFLTLLDDASRVTWIFFIKNKSQTAQTLSNFITYIHTQYNKAIKCIRLDNGLEFPSTLCQQLFSDHGILHQKSCPYTPQQNEKVERKHKDLLILYRSLLL